MPKNKKKQPTPAQKATKKKRAKRPPAIDGMSIDEFILNNADPLWLHHNEMWEHIPEEGPPFQPRAELPATPQEWIEEIALAYADAFAAIPFGVFAGSKITDADLFHLGPSVCIKFRGLKRNKTNLQKATEAALTSYVATQEIVGELFDIPQMAFAFCYIASHFGLDLIDENESAALLEHIENNLDRLIELCDTRI